MEENSKREISELVSRRAHTVEEMLCSMLAEVTDAQQYDAIRVGTTKDGAFKIKVFGAARFPDGPHDYASFEGHGYNLEDAIKAAYANMNQEIIRKIDLAREKAARELKAAQEIEELPELASSKEDF